MPQLQMARLLRTGKGCVAGALYRHCPVAPLSTSATMSDKTHQPTGRQGMPSPWLRTPFFHERGPPPGVDKSLQERLDDLYPKNIHLGDKVDIGFAPDDKKRQGQNLAREWRKQTRANKELEKAAREGTLEIDMRKVREDWMESGAAFDDIKTAGELYGIFEDLFGHAYFRPCVHLDIKYRHEDVLVPVYRGNMVKPSEASLAPLVRYNSDNDSLWSLVMTGLDSHFTSETDQYLHWMLTNIKGSDLASGHLNCSYCQPFPAFGTGYHRYTLVLFKQETNISVADVKENEDTIDLAARSFNMSEFYREHQDNLTPAGLAFFQSDYESGLRDFFHNKLQMKEPRYEYEFPDWYVTPWMSHINTNLKDGFDEFLDRHRNPKDVEREVLEAKLGNTDPFLGNKESYVKYPGIHQIELEEQFPPPKGEKRLNPKQSFKIAQWRRNAIQRQRMKERYFRSTDHKELRQDPLPTRF